MSAGEWVLLVALLASVGFGLFRALTDGRFRGTHRIRGASAPEAPAAVASVLDGTPWADRGGERGERDRDEGGGEGQAEAGAEPRCHAREPTGPGRPAVVPQVNDP